MIPPGIDVKAIEPSPPTDRARPVILHAPSSRRRKGTEHVIAACEGLDAELVLVEGLHHDEAFERYREADIVVDQLNAGWYGLFAIECMALGKPVVTFLHDEAVRRTEEALGATVPIVSATKDDLRARLEPLVASATERRRIGEASRAYVEEVHDLDRVADRLLARALTRVRPAESGGARRTDSSGWASTRPSTGSGAWSRGSSRSSCSRSIRATSPRRTTGRSRPSSRSPP